MIQCRDAIHGNPFKRLVHWPFFIVDDFVQFQHHPGFDDVHQFGCQFSLRETASFHVSDPAGEFLVVGPPRILLVSGDQFRTDFGNPSLFDFYVAVTGNKLVFDDPSSIAQFHEAQLFSGQSIVVIKSNGLFEMPTDLFSESNAAALLLLAPLCQFDVGAGIVGNLASSLSVVDVAGTCQLRIKFQAPAKDLVFGTIGRSDN